MRLWLLAIQCPRLQMKADFHPDTLKWNVHMCLMLLLFIAASLQHVGFHLMPFLTICNLKNFFKALHSQRVQVPVYRYTENKWMWSSRATCPPQVNYLWAVLIVLTDASGGETPWASCCSMLWLLQTPTDSLFCLLPQAHSWISLQIFSAEFFFLINTIILFFTLPPKTKHCTGTHVEIYKLFEHQCS